MSSSEKKPKTYKDNLEIIDFSNISLPSPIERYIVVDTATTGANPKENNIIEIACVEILKGKITGNEFHAFLHPRYQMNSFSEQKTKLSSNFYEEYFNDVYFSDKKCLENFRNFVGNNMIFAHNAMRDMEFINNELNYWNLKMIPKRNFYCTLKIFKEMFPNLSRNYCSLSKCCEYFELLPPAENYHSAIFDSFMAARMVCKFFEIFNEFEKRKNDKLNVNKIEKFNDVNVRENKILNGDDNLVLQEDQSDFYDINTSFENDNNNNNNNSENNNNKNKIEEHKENDDLNDENKKHFKQKLSDEPIDLDANDLNDLMKDL